MSVNHYENFPVASVLLPAKLRPAVKNIYAFARTADDIADEGNAKIEFRQEQLSTWQTAVNSIYTNKSLPNSLSITHQQIFIRLKDTIKQHNLPRQAFLDLLAAFEQDLYVNSYTNRNALLAYCQLSANPVGLLMLHLFQAVTELNIKQSDAICSGLQLANFWQDISIDNSKQRCYIPIADLERHGFNLSDINSLCQTRPNQISLKWQSLIKEQVDFASQLLITGSPLAWRLPGRIGWELRLVVHGGLRILQKIALNGYNPFAKRPMLDFYDRYLLCWRALHKPSMHNFKQKL